jgi:hypothetical protein
MVLNLNSVKKTNINNHNNNQKLKQSGGDNTWSYLPLDTVNQLEPIAAYYNVSHKARGLQKPTKSDKGFLKVYREAKGKPVAFESLPVKAKNPQGENWRHHREDFCNRRYAMIKTKKNYGLFDKDTGLPTVMHTNMLMWACSPESNIVKKNTKKYLATIKKLKSSKTSK